VYSSVFFDHEETLVDLDGMAGFDFDALPVEFGDINLEVVPYDGDAIPAEFFFGPMAVGKTFEFWALATREKDCMVWRT